MEWDSEDIKIWHFPRIAVPYDIRNAPLVTPDPRRVCCSRLSFLPVRVTVRAVNAPCRLVSLPQKLTTTHLCLMIVITITDQLCSSGARRKLALEDRNVTQIRISTI